MGLAAEEFHPPRPAALPSALNGLGWIQSDNQPHLAIKGIQHHLGLRQFQCINCSTSAGSGGLVFLIHAKMAFTFMSLCMAKAVPPLGAVAPFMWLGAKRLPKRPSPSTGLR